MDKSPFFLLLRRTPKTVQIRPYTRINATDGTATIMQRSDPRHDIAQMAMDMLIVAARSMPFSSITPASVLEQAMKKDYSGALTGTFGEAKLIPATSRVPARIMITPK